MSSFSKEERVAFDQLFQRFEDGLVVSKLFNSYQFPGGGVEAERASNTIWRPMPYIAQIFNGLDQSANFNRNYTQLSVPTTLGYQKSVPFTLSATELRDALQESRIGDAALQRVASQINVDCSNIAALQGTQVIKRTAAASGFDDVAQADSAFNRIGVPMGNRKLTLASSDYNSMANNLQAASRSFGNDVSDPALRDARVGRVSGFDTYKLDYAYRLTAALGTGVTVNGANQYYVPKATSTAGTGEVSNVDNRYQSLTITVTSGTVKVGDCFTIAGVNEVHAITKQDTGVLRTFRVQSIVSGGGGSGVIQISPPIISGTGGTDPELQYQNVSATPANGAAITWLNTTAAAVNPFWQGDCFEIMSGRYMPKMDSGMSVMYGTTEQGITVTMTRQGAIGDLSTKYRFDTFYGIVCKQPTMAGVILFGQA